MAVQRVYGKCDGYDIVFYRNEETGRWDAAVPFDRDGEYVVEIRAVDEVGNESYYATLLFIVDTTKLCVKVKVLKVSAQARSDGLIACTKVRMTKYKARVARCELCGSYHANAKIKKYSTKMVRCELCGRF